MDRPARGSDTPDDIHRRMIERWRAATPDEKLDRMFGMAEMVNELSRARVRQQYPDATPREVQLRLASRVLPRETMIVVWGWDPDVQGR
ncbi:MAG: hypothetical protein WKG01_17760 [Kofleriaceae bacterium]